MFEGKQILVTPLNWGLGHASRCVPVIDSLKAEKAEVILGLDGVSGLWLKQRYPELRKVDIPGYEVTYSKGSSQVWAMAKQMPALNRSIKREHLITEDLVAELDLDAIISDQRFGCFSASIPSIILSHQVFPKTPFVNQILIKQNHKWLSSFDQVWIVDNEERCYAGQLSASIEKSRYVGSLSRFSKHAEKLDRKYRCVAIATGPEPQKSIFIDIITQQLNGLEGKHLLLAGDPGVASITRGNVDIHGNLKDNELVPFLLGCELIVSRSGYSTIMDLDALQRPALLIPTPGQPEQEYLASLHDEGQFVIQHQDAVDLRSGLGKISSLALQPKQPNKSLLVRALQDLSDLLNS